jgi:hypothetical protein
VTVVDPVPPPAATDCNVGASETVHGAGAWLTVNVCPPIVIVPARVVPLGSPCTQICVAACIGGAYVGASGQTATRNFQQTQKLRTVGLGERVHRGGLVFPRAIGELRESGKTP